MNHIVITGASRGIGYEVAKQLSQDPERRIVAIARNTQRLQNLADEAAHQNIIPLPGDLTDSERISQVVLERLGSVDALLNNAGLLINKPFEELTQENWQQLWEVNVMAPASLAKQLIPAMGLNNTQAHIVNIGSMGGFQGSSKFPGLAAYSTTKAAVASLSECLAEELKDRNISVNCLALGAVQTEMLQEAFPGMEVPMSSETMGAYIANFLIQGHQFYNGKVLPISSSTP